MHFHGWLLLILAVGNENTSPYLAQVIRCPPGWIPIGPYCTATVSVLPWTECPMGKHRYRQPHVLRNAYSSPTPGICMNEERMGMTLRCPHGLQLELNPNPRPAEVAAPKRYILNQDHRGNRKAINKLRFALLQATGSDRPPNPAQRRRLSDPDWSLPVEWTIPEEFDRIGDVLADGDETGELDDLDYDPVVPNLDTFDEDAETWEHAAEYRCVGVDQRVYSPQQWRSHQEQCPMGYNLKQVFTSNQTLWPYAEHSHICEGFVVTPPEPFCPPTTKPAAHDFNPATFMALKALHCVKDVRYKGRCWCPDTFRLIRETFPGLPFSSEIAPETPEDPYDPYVYDRVGFVQSAGPACVRSVVLHHRKCDQLTCKDGVLKEIEGIVKHFAYHKLQRDPFYIKFDSVPSGKDWRWAPNNKHYPF